MYCVVTTCGGNVGAGGHGRGLGGRRRQDFDRVDGDVTIGIHGTGYRRPHAVVDGQAAAEIDDVGASGIADERIAVLRRLGGEVDVEHPQRPGRLPALHGGLRGRRGRERADGLAVQHPPVGAPRDRHARAFGQAVGIAEQVAIPAARLQHGVALRDSRQAVGDKRSRRPGLPPATLVPKRWARWLKQQRRGLRPGARLRSGAPRVQGRLHRRIA